jgi:hypothetical protein
MTPKQIATLIIENIHENNGLIHISELLIEEITKTNYDISKPVPIDIVEDIVPPHNDTLLYKRPEKRGLAEL